MLIEPAFGHTTVAAPGCGVHDDFLIGCCVLHEYKLLAIGHEWVCLSASENERLSGNIPGWFVDAFQQQIEEFFPASSD
jgi:hypothetical protein